MRKKHIRDRLTELNVAYGYEFDELYDTETPEELGEPIKEEEVAVRFGRDEQKKRIR